MEQLIGVSPVAAVEMRRASHRYRTFMMDEILSDATKTLGPPCPDLMGSYPLLYAAPPPAFPRPLASYKFSLVHGAAVSCPLLSVASRGAPGLLGGGALGIGAPFAGELRPRGDPSGRGPRSKRCRRSRTVFTELQLLGLERKFEKQKYLSTPDRMDLAESLGLSQLQVKTWYQNRRMKWKKMVLEGGVTDPPTKPKGRPRKSSLLEERRSTESPPRCGPSVEADLEEDRAEAKGSGAAPGLPGERGSD